MTSPPNQTSIPDLITAYVLGQFGEQKSKQFQQQLKSNPTLAQEVRAYQIALSLLPYSLAHQAPPISLKGSLLHSALEAQLVSEDDAQSYHRLNARQGVPDFHSQDFIPQPSLPARSSSLISRLWSTAMLGILTASAGTALFDRWQLRQQFLQTAFIKRQFQRDRRTIPPLRQERPSHSELINSLSQPSTQIHALTSTGSYQASASLLATPETAELAFVATDIPILDGKEVYRLWALGEDSSSPVIYCGQFRHDSNGTARWVAPNIACTQGNLKLLVTLDAPGAPTTSMGLPILESQVMESQV